MSGELEPVQLSLGYELEDNHVLLNLQIANVGDFALKGIELNLA